MYFGTERTIKLAPLWAPQKLYYILYTDWIDSELLLEIRESTGDYWEQSGALTKGKTEDSNKAMWLSCMTQEGTWIKRETLLRCENQPQWH